MPNFGATATIAEMLFRVGMFACVMTVTLLCPSKGLDHSFEFGHGWVASIDAWLTTIGDQENGSFTGNTGSLNVSLTKTFFDERLSIRLQGYDLLGTVKKKMLSYFDGIQTEQIGWSDSREIGLTVRYKFNTTRSKYKGTGAGNEEKNRL